MEGYPLALYISAANLHDTDGLRQVMLRHPNLQIQRLFADQGHRGQVARDCADRGIILEVVERAKAICSKEWTLKTMQGFLPAAKRWVIERTFAWLGRFRRLTKDYEYLSANSEFMNFLAAMRLILRKLCALVVRA